MKRGIIVTGELGLIDAAVVRLLRALKAEYGSVWATPTGSMLDPAVSLYDIRYVLGQLACVDGVIESVDHLPPKLPCARFPIRLIGDISPTIRADIADDEAMPDACTIEGLLVNRPVPLVLLTGCFDLIHSGHVRLIEIASTCGSPPVVAALTSRAIRAQPKNANRNRPLWAMADRVCLLEELRAQPKVLLFDGPDCLELIERLRPDVWVKEIRDRGRAIVEQEARLVEMLGGRVFWADNGGYGSSTTIIEQAICSQQERV